MTFTVGAAKAYANQQGLDALDAEVLLAHCLKKDRAFLFTWPEYRLTSAEQEQFLSNLEQRVLGLPIAYILGSKEFWSLTLKTHESTLIPRPDTEVLVEAVLNTQGTAPLNCLDLGTGTGAIALALKSERPRWSVTGIDCVAEAVALARENAKNLALDVQFQQGEWCLGIANNSVDIVVSNPPYIDANDEHLKQGDVRFEPMSALVAGDEGLADIQRIVQQAKTVFRDEGWLYLEHGWQQASKVQYILKINGYQNIQTIKDYGNNDRVTFGHLLK